MHKGKGKNSAAVVAAAALALTGAAAAWAQVPPPDSSQAPPSVPCSKHADGRYHCRFWPAGDGIHGGAVVVNGRGYWVGYLNRGDDWVSCQMWGGKVRHGAFYNHWWAWTEANDHRWGWVNAVWASGGANDGKFAGVPGCDPVHSAAPPGQRSSGPAKRTPKPRMHAPRPKRSGPAQVPCRSIGGGKHQCTFWPAGDGHSGGAPVRNASGHVVGYLHKGSNWIVCQQQGRRATHGRYHNNNWGWTLADDGKWGWVNAVWASGGANDGGFGGTPPCYGSHGNPPGVSYPVQPPANPKPPPPAPSGSIIGSIPHFVTVTNNAGCPRIEFIAAAGSGETTAGTVLTQLHGDFVTATHNRGVSGIGFGYVNYHPASISVLISGAISGAASNFSSIQLGISDGIRPYMNSIVGGWADTLAVINAFARVCPNTQLVTAGYSQGAIVVHRVMTTLQEKYSGVLTHVNAVLLVGDGARVPNTAAARSFGVGAGSGAGAEWFGADVGVVARPGDIQVPGRTAEICARLDIVCDTTDTLEAASRAFLLGGASGMGVIRAVDVIKEGASAHTGYATNAAEQGLLRNAATFAAYRVH